MISTKIVEIPVDGNMGLDCSKFLTDFDAFDAFDEYFFNSQKQHATQQPLTQANLANLQPITKDFLPRESDVHSNASSNSFFGFEDYNNQNFLSDDDFIQSSLDLEPTSPSPIVEDLSRNFNTLRRPSMEDVPTFTPKEAKPFEKEENEDDSSDDDDQDIETNPLLIKKALSSQSITESLDSARSPMNGKKRVKLAHKKTEGGSSVSSLSSEESDPDNVDEESDAEVSDDVSEEELDDGEDSADDNSDSALKSKNGGSMEPLLRKYKLPVSLHAENLSIGNWSMRKDNASPDSETLQGLPLNELSLDIKILFGRRKIKYELTTPNKLPKTKSLFAIDFSFNSISGIWFDADNREITFQLNEPPNFTKKEKGRSSRMSDFTEGNAIRFCKHHIYVENELSLVDFQDSLLSCDKRLRQISKLPGNDDEPSFPKEQVFKVIGRGPICDWDKENPAIKRCEDCNSNYCIVCDDVLHRHENQKTHRRVPVVIKPPQPPRPRRTPPKKRKKMYSDRCRCGTGATKGTLGEPCTGNRCPCFSNGKNCANCGCKNCANPIKVTKKDPPSFSPKLVKQSFISAGNGPRSTRAHIRANSSTETF